MQLNKLRHSANTLLELNKFEDAFAVYDSISENIFYAAAYSNNLINNFSKNHFKKNSKEIISFKEQYLSKIFDNYCEQRFNLNSEQVLYEFQLSLFGALRSVSQSNTLCAVVPKEIYLAKTLLLQNSIIEEQICLPILISKTFTTLIENELSLKIKPNFTTDFISNQIIKNADKINHTDYSDSNNFLLDYLVQIGEIHSTLFKEIKNKINYNFNFRQKYKSSSKSHTKQEYEKYERYEKHEFYEKYERKTSSDAEFDFTNATDFEKANYFGKLFGLKGRITKSQIRKIYIELINKYHPDKVSNLGDELKELAEKKTKLINIAYEYFKKKYKL